MVLNINNNKMEKLNINGIEYVKLSDITTGDYSIIRGDRSGVFYGIIETREGSEVSVLNCRRVWYWTGAASISQLANDGTSSPETCKFPEAVKKQLILDAIEIIPMTEKALESLNSVEIWKQ
jgi:hypothetical protein